MFLIHTIGLCVLHLLTGNEPYEELLKDVHCPVYLKEQVRISIHEYVQGHICVYVYIRKYVYVFI
jgi:hypothetical protein